MVIVQEYFKLNPSLLIVLMGQQLTKKDVESGYKLSETAAERKVGDRILKGKVFVTSHPSQEWNREIVAYGDRDTVVLIVTMISRSRST